LIFCSIKEAELCPETSLIVNGGSSIFLPHYVDPPKCATGKTLLEVCPYVCINNGQQTATWYYHYGEYSQDPNFVLSILWIEIEKIFKASKTKLHTLYIQVHFFTLYFLN